MDYGTRLGEVCARLEQSGPDDTQECCPMLLSSVTC